MDELISRQIVLNEFCHSCDGWSCNPNTCCKTEWIRKLPPIQPEIVRCEERLYRKICSWEKQGAKFCSFAERREVNNESN